MKDSEGWCRRDSERWCRGNHL